MPETTISAEIDRETLRDILNTALTGLREKHQTALDDLDKSIVRLAESRHKGLFRWRRNWTTEEARTYVNNSGWWWSEYREVSAAAENVRRAAKLLSMVEKESLHSIRLSETDLVLLNEFMA